MNRGVAIHTTKLELGTKHTEKNSLTQLMGPSEQYLGLLKLWNQYQIISTPLLSATELSNNVMYTNGLGASLSYSVPVKFALPFTTDDINEEAKPGLNREVFWLLLNTPNYTKGDLLTYDRENGKQVVVDFSVEENPAPYGGGAWLYGVKLTSDDPKDFVSRRFTAAGISWVKIGNVKSEWSRENSAITQDSDGTETLMFKTGNALQSVEHWMTGHADMLEYNVDSRGGGTNLAQTKSVMGQFADPHKAAVMYFFETLGDPNDPNNPDIQKNPIPNSGRWMPVIIMMLMKETARMQNDFYMYSQGGVVWDGRGTATRIGMGYYPQIKSSGNYHTYQKPEQIGPLLKEITGDLFFGRVDLPYDQRKVKFRMGMGALIETQKYFKREFGQDIAFTVWAQHKALDGMLTGTNLDLSYKGYRFTSFLFPEVGFVEIEHDPALDQIGTKETNGFRGRYSTKSYRVFVEDLTEGAFSNAMPPAANYDVREGFNNGANVVLVKPKNYDKVYSSYRVGTYCPDMLKTYVGAGANAHMRSDDDNKFSVQMQWAGEVWVKDPSRTILIELEDLLETA